MTKSLKDAFYFQAKACQFQAKACQDLGSPFMHQLMMILGNQLTPDTPLTKRLFEWPGDLGPAGASLPLRLAGSLHSLSRQGKGELNKVYPPNIVTDENLWKVVSNILQSESIYINKFIDNPPQTNEVRRGAVLLAAGHWLAEKFKLPIQLFELGASAGLNLMWDRFELIVKNQSFGQSGSLVSLSPEWEGPLPEQTRPSIIGRSGVDLLPLDPVCDRDRLLSYLWPDQPQRIALTDAAIDIAEAKVDKADAIDWLSQRLAAKEGVMQLVYSTVAWQYLSHTEQQKGSVIIETAGRIATRTSPIAWFTMETDGKGPGAELSLRLWPGNYTIHMGRADFHGRWVDWSPPPVTGQLG